MPRPSRASLLVPALIAGCVLSAYAAPKNVWKPAKVQLEAAKKTGKPVVFTNTIGMKFMLVPAGNFMMGSPAGRMNRNPFQEHQYRVVISRSYYLQTTEVTQDQWLAVMGNHPSRFKGRGDLPVENVSHPDAVMFIQRLNRREGTTKYRLPTEAEWEYACRAGTTTVFSFGNSSKGLIDYAWYRDNSGGKTHPVGKKLPNPWGLYDMHGNVWEWCSDWYKRGYYDIAPSVDPKGPSSGSDRVLRGGSWGDAPVYLGSADRGEHYPEGRSRAVGFRVARDL